MAGFSGEDGDSSLIGCGCSKPRLGAGVEHNPIRAGALIDGIFIRKSDSVGILIE